MYIQCRQHGLVGATRLYKLDGAPRFRAAWPRDTQFYPYTAPTLLYQAVGRTKCALEPFLALEKSGSSSFPAFLIAGGGTNVGLFLERDGPAYGVHRCVLLAGTVNTWVRAG